MDCTNCGLPAHGYTFQHMFVKSRACTQCGAHCRWDRHWIQRAASGDPTPLLSADAWEGVRQPWLPAIRPAQRLTDAIR